MKSFVFIIMILVTSVCSASDYKPKAGTVGSDIFSQACAACHGDDGQGKFGLFFDLTSSKMDIDTMKSTVQKGGTMMPSFANIKGEELDGLIAYVSSLGKKSVEK